MKNILFVALSHTLTVSQVAGFKAQFGQDTDIVTIADVNPELAKTIQNIDPNLDGNAVCELAKQVYNSARLVNATHFCCQGEPCLQIQANDFANGVMKCVVATTERNSIDEPQPDGSIKKTVIFNHVMWRTIF